MLFDGHTYAAFEMLEQLKRGPYPGEDFYRLRVTGDGSTKTVNVTADQLERIAAILDVPVSA
jgi:triacylglycerol esterase/lipase EstA (alpha/beta hydrolase family)